MYQLVPVAIRVHLDPVIFQIETKSWSQRDWVIPEVVHEYDPELTVGNQATYSLRATSPSPICGALTMPNILP